MAINECIPYYRPGTDLTCQATAAITGKRFVKISGNRVSGPGIPATAQVGASDPVDGGNYRVAPAGAGEDALGVSSYDSPSGDKVAVIADPGVIVPVTAGAAIVAGTHVESDATGRAVPLDAGVDLGKAMTAASGANVDAEIKLR